MRSSSCGSICCLSSLASLPSAGRCVGRRRAERLQQRRDEPALAREIAIAERPQRPPRSPPRRGRARTAARSAVDLRSQGHGRGSVTPWNSGAVRLTRLRPPRAPSDAATLTRRPRRLLRGSRLAPWRRSSASLRERRRRGDRELREHLAVERVARGLEPGDQLAVGQAVLARGGVDPHHPQAAEVALLAAAADERVLERGVDRLFRGAIQLALGLVEALRAREQLLPLRAPDVFLVLLSALSLPRNFNFSCQLPASCTCALQPLTLGTDAISTAASVRSFGLRRPSTRRPCPRSPRFRLRDLLVRMWRLNALLRMNLPVPVFLKRLAAPRCVFSFGMCRLRFSRVRPL